MRPMRRALIAVAAAAGILVAALVAVTLTHDSPDAAPPAREGIRAAVETAVSAPPHTAAPAAGTTRGRGPAGGARPSGRSAARRTVARSRPTRRQDRPATAATPRRRPRLTPRKRARLVMQYAVTRQTTPTVDDDPASTELAVNSPPASALPGILRPCEQARNFTVYTLGERFHDYYATHLGVYCQKPPAVVDGKVAVPTRDNDTEVFYGPCRGGGSQGCGYDVSVRNLPSCERPYWLYTALTGPPGEETAGPNLVTLRGVPAAVFEDRIELWTRDTTIVVFADPRLAREAVDALRSTSGATTPGAPLPTPARDVVSPKLTPVRCTS
jgi:hypothetical protein